MPIEARASKSASTFRYRIAVYSLPASEWWTTSVHVLPGAGAGVQGHLQGGQRQLGQVMVGHGPADDPAGEHVQHERRERLARPRSPGR